ncbi:hypothetical protein BDV95DRAFT_569054 [Massariosphaeria phaeospora]|uniref:Uncharacterized protein n=1 Tax=Massariosphaeria phaeospora TaxID=100035 RepID=A0A7C8IA72_9PLEO|nr:hypothetical protein BDV95DRAFT_569054 [Massariosphaeria phaeospora]
MTVLESHSQSKVHQIVCILEVLFIFADFDHIAPSVTFDASAILSVVGFGRMHQLMEDGCVRLRVGVDQCGPGEYPELSAKSHPLICNSAQQSRHLRGLVKVHELHGPWAQHNVRHAIRRLGESLGRFTCDLLRENSQLGLRIHDRMDVVFELDLGKRSSVAEEDQPCQGSLGSLKFAKFEGGVGDSSVTLSCGLSRPVATNQQLEQPRRIRIL